MIINSDQAEFRFVRTNEANRRPTRRRTSGEVGAKSRPLNDFAQHGRTSAAARFASETGNRDSGTTKKESQRARPLAVFEAELREPLI
jgi:hypothetical protein